MEEGEGSSVRGRKGLRRKIAAAAVVIASREHQNGSSSCVLLAFTQS